MNRGLRLRRLEDRRKSCFLLGSLELQRGFRREETAATCRPEGAATATTGRAAAIFAASYTG
jgi:hypothetical protein